MRIAAALLAATVLTGASAHAAVITWELDGTFFQDAGTAAGSFRYDTILNTFSGIALQTSRTGGGGGVYDAFLGSDISDDSVIFGNAGANPDSAQIALMLAGVRLADLASPGTLPINPSAALADFAEFGCADLAQCSSGFGSSVTNWALNGASTLTGTVQPVPLPAALPLVASGLAFFGLIAARRRRA
jgi:hypothetical protein